MHAFKTFLSFCPALFLFAAAATTETSFAQPVLERVEQGVRRQLSAPVGEPPASPPVAAEPGYLGIIAEPVSPQGGVRIRESIAGGPAAAAGLMAGDVIAAIDGRAIAQIPDMGAVLKPLAAGAKVDFEVDRGGKRQTITVTLSARPTAGQRRFPEFGEVPEGAAPQPAPRPDRATTAPPPPRLGVRTELVTEEDRRRLNYNGAGAKITSITRGSPAESAALPIGAIITAVDGQAIETPTQMASLVQAAPAGHRLELTYLSSGQQFRKAISLAGVPGQAARPAPPSAADAPPTLGYGGGGFPADPAARIQMLEDRVEKLEARIRDLEAALSERARSSEPK